MSDVYIVTSGCYSDYGIDQVFKSREKAELYCECHEGCEIEEWDFNDDRIYTAYDYVYVLANIHMNNNKCSVQCRFGKYSIEDEPSNRNKTFAWSFGKNFEYRDKRIEVHLYRELPKNYSKMQVEYKWTRIMEDLAAEIRYEFSGMEGVSDRVVSEFVKAKLGGKEAEYEE